MIYWKGCQWEGYQARHHVWGIQRILPYEPQSRAKIQKDIWIHLGGSFFDTIIQDYQRIGFINNFTTANIPYDDTSNFEILNDKILEKINFIIVQNLTLEFARRLNVLKFADRKKTKEIIAKYFEFHT